MAGFTNQLAEVNRLAETSPGFVWTPVDAEAGDAVATFGNPLVLANISTWRSLEVLRRFVYDGLHGGALKQRREWFEPVPGPAYVLWWAAAGHRPNWIEASSGFTTSNSRTHAELLRSRTRSVRPESCFFWRNNRPKHAVPVSKSAEDTMLYMLIGHFRRGVAPAGSGSPGNAQHVDTSDLTLIGSWVEATLGRSFHVVDCENLAALQQWAARWRHRVEFELVPVVPRARSCDRRWSPCLVEVNS